MPKCMCRMDTKADYSVSAYRKIKPVQLNSAFWKNSANFRGCIFYENLMCVQFGRKLCRKYTGS